MRGDLIVSAVVHGAIVLGAFVSLASPKPFASLPVDWMSVDLVTPSELAGADRKDVPDFASAPVESQQNVPGQSPAQAPQPTPRPPTDAVSASAHSDSQTEPPEQKPAEPASAAASEPSSYETMTAAAMMDSPLTHPSEGFEQIDDPADLSGDMMRKLQARLQQCWSLPAGTSDAAKLNVLLRVRFRPNGALAGEPVLMAAPASAAGPALVQSAMRALAQCQPYGFLPADKYKEWKALDLSFSAQGLTLGARGMSFTPPAGG